MKVTRHPLLKLILSLIFHWLFLWWQLLTSITHTVTYSGQILVVFWTKSVKILVCLRNLTKVIFNQKIFDLSTKKITNVWLQKYGFQNQNYSGWKSVIFVALELFWFSPSHITYIKEEKKEGESEKLRMKTRILNYGRKS